MKKYNRHLALLLTFALLLGGCGGSPAGETAGTAETVAEGTQSGEATEPATSGSAAVDTSDIFSDRDLDAGYDESKSAVITLSGSSASCPSDAVQISGGTVTITDEGTYILSGTLDDGMIIINTEKSDKTQLVLDGVSIRSETSAAIYVLQSDKVFITLAEGSVNTLSNGGSFTAIDENNIDAVIYSKEDLTLNGSGALTVTSPGGHGIVSKDSLTITGGTYDISSASHGLAGKDDLCVVNAGFTITSGKDGIHAENADDSALGFVYIQSGTFDISAEGDGISAAAYMQIQDGTFDIVSGGGSANAADQTSDNWGSFMGRGKDGHGAGRGGAGGGMGSPGGEMGSMVTETESPGEDSTSIKGIKASGELTINGGSFTIDSADDAVHSNASITVNAGTFAVTSGDDGFHADDTLTVNGGSIDITESYEGLEGLHVEIAGGNISLAASDDGINAAGGTDSSGFGGQRGGDMFGGGFGGGSSSGGSITISGGTLCVNASGDGIDANGTLTISGGYTTVCGPTQGDTATLDYDASAVITGGTFIGTGASGMAQTFSTSEQGVIAVNVGSQAAGTHITLTDGGGNTVISYTPALSFSVVILSSPDIVKGESYTISVGSATGTFAAS